MKKWTLALLSVVGLGAAVVSCSGDGKKSNNNNRCYTDSYGRRVCDNNRYGYGNYGYQDCGYNSYGQRCNQADLGYPECQYDRSGRRCDPYAYNGNNYGWGSGYTNGNYGSCGPGFVEYYTIYGVECVPFAQVIAAIPSYSYSYGPVYSCGMGFSGCYGFPYASSGLGFSAGFGISLGIGFGL